MRADNKPTKSAPHALSTATEAGAYRRARLLGNEVWLTQDQVNDQFKRARRRRTADQLRRSRRLIGVSIDGVYLYPVLQFDAAMTRPLPIIAQLLAVIPANASEWETVMWLFEPRRDLEGDRPVDNLATHPVRVVRAAREDFHPPPSSW